jgi:hypothetical protein
MGTAKGEPQLAMGLIPIGGVWEYNRSGSIWRSSFYEGEF